MNDWMGFDAPETRSRTFRACVFVGCISAAIIVVVLGALGVFGGGA